MANYGQMPTHHCLHNRDCLLDEPGPGKTPDREHLGLLEFVVIRLAKQFHCGPSVSTWKQSHCVRPDVLTVSMEAGVYLFFDYSHLGKHTIRLYSKMTSCWLLHLLVDVFCCFSFFSFFSSYPSIRMALWVRNQNPPFSFLLCHQKFGFYQVPLALVSPMKTRTVDNTVAKVSFSSCIILPF